MLPARNSFRNRTSTKLVSWTAVILGAVVASALAAQSPGPVPISPGASSGSAPSASSCPTFSWAFPEVSAQRLRGVELRIVAAPGPAGLESAGAVRALRLPAGARSWTPSAEECFEPGGRFSWSIRGLPRDPDGGTTRERAGWSEAWRFDVGGRPAEEELAWAIDVLRRSRASSGATEAVSAGSSGAVTSQERTTGGSVVPSPPTAPAEVRTATGAAVSTNSAFAGVIQVAGVDAEEVTASSVETLTELFAGTLTMVSGADVLTLWSDGNRTVLSDDFDPGSGTGTENGFLLVDTLSTTEELEVGYLGLQVLKGAWDAGGGAGYGSVPVELAGLNDTIKVDDNPSICPDGSIVVGMRLAETDNDQLGIQVRCTRKPRP